LRARFGVKNGAQTIASQKFLKIFSMRFFGTARLVCSFARLARHACKSITNDGRQQRAAQKSLFFSMKIRDVRGALPRERIAQ
jgi:hypothetical protein